MGSIIAFMQYDFAALGRNYEFKNGRSFEERYASKGWSETDVHSLGFMECLSITCYNSYHC